MIKRGLVAESGLALTRGLLSQNVIQTLGQQGLSILGMPPTVWQVGEEVSFLLSASGGSGSFDFGIPDGWIAVNESPDTARVRFVPQHAGEMTFAAGQFHVTDGDGTRADLGSFTVEIEPPEVAPITIQGTPPTDAVAGLPLSFTITHAGGVAPRHGYAPAGWTVWDDTDQSTFTTTFRAEGPHAFGAGDFYITDRQGGRANLAAFSITAAPVDLGREAGAVAHYQFGTDNTAMQDMAGGQAITGPSPAHKTGFATISNAYKGELTLPVTDNADITAVIAFKGSNAAERFFAMRLGENGSDGWNMRWLNDETHPDFLTTRWPGGPGSLKAKHRRLNDWYFAAISIRADGRMTTLLSDFYDLHENDVDDTRGTPLTGTKIKIGGFNSAFGGAMHLAEVVVFHDYKSPAELRELMARSHARCLARGVAFKVPAAYALQPVWEDGFGTNDIQQNIFALPTRDGITAKFSDVPQFAEDIGNDRSLRLEMLRDTDEVTYSALRFEIEPGQSYALYYSLAGMQAANWEVRGGPDEMTEDQGAPFFAMTHSAGTQGEMRANFTAGAGNNILKLLFAVSGTAGHFREISGIRLVNLTGTVAPVILEPQQQLPPVVGAGGVYYVDFENGSNSNDGRSIATAFQTAPQSNFGGTEVLFPRGGKYPVPLSIRTTGSTRSNNVKYLFDDDRFDPKGLGPANPCSINRGGDMPAAQLHTAGPPAIYDTIFPNDVNGEKYKLFMICGDEWIVPAQFPHPSNRIKQENRSDYIALADGAFTTTSITSDALPALDAMQALAGGDVVVRFHTTNSNRYEARIIETYTANGDGTATITWSTPAVEPHLSGFAIVNHLSGMDAPGGGVFQTDGDLLLFRDVSDANPTAKKLRYAKGGNGIVILGDYVELQSPLVELFSGSGILAEGTAGDPRTGLEIRKPTIRYGLGGGIGFENVENFLITESDIDLIRETSADTGGFRFDNCAMGVIVAGKTDRIAGNQAHNGSSRRIYYVGVDIGEGLGGHTNGYRFYGGNSDCALMFCSSVSATRAMAVQNTRGNISCVGCSFHFLSGVNYWGSTTNSPYPEQNDLIEKGGHTIINSVFDGGPLVLTAPDHTNNAVLANLIFKQGASTSVWSGEDQETGTDRFAATSVQIDNPGTGHSRNDTVSFPAGLELRIDGVDANGGITAWTIWKGGASPTVPTEVAQVSTNGSGKGAVVSALQTVSARPLIQSHNVFLQDTGSKKQNPDPQSAARDDSILGFALTPTPATFENIFADTVSPPGQRDYRPNLNGPLDFTAGKSVKFDIHPDDYARFGPTWPAGGIAFDWLGRYDPATGQDAWDWRNADFQVL